MKTLIDLIARHHPDKDGAIALIDALEKVVGMAESYLEDVETGVGEGIYEAQENKDFKELSGALDLVDD